MKGRKILTVSKDGRGQFKTIQSAIDTLQAGEVVKVLDRGPYRERLEFAAPPQDSGLVSDVGTVLELPEWKVGWKEGTPEQQIYVGHWIQDTNGFRLSGFDLVFPKKKDGLLQGLYINEPAGVVVENCRIPRAEPSEKRMLELVYFKKKCLKPSCIRECLIEGGILILTSIPDAALIVERNWFYDVKATGHLNIWGEGDFKSLVIRNNLFGGPSSDYDIRFAMQGRMTLDLSNNTLTSRNPSLFANNVVKGSATIRNNLHTRRDLFHLLGGAAKDTTAIRSWLVGPNCYPADADGDHKNLFPRGVADILVAPVFLSTAATDPNYLRLAGDSLQVRGGSGGAWPSYMGSASWPSPQGRRLVHCACVSAWSGMAPDAKPLPPPK